MSKKNSCIRCIHKEACSALRSAAGNLQDYHKDCKHFKDIDLFEEKTPAEAEAEKLFDLQCEARSILESGMEIIMEQFGSSKTNFSIMTYCPDFKKEYFIRNLFNGKKTMVVSVEFIKSRG